jgi:TRAP-type C4-dicarboxylate transport system substrate-binding protein
VIVNEDSFAKLSAATQEKVRKIVSDAMPEVTQALRDTEVVLGKQFAAEGMIITEPPADEAAKNSAQFTDYWQSWAKARGPEAVEALAKIRAALGR